MQPTPDNLESQQPYLDCRFAETKDLASYALKWDDVSLKLFLEYNQADSIARQRAMYTTIANPKMDDEQLKAELAEIKKTSDETMEAVWKLLSMRNVHLFVEVQQPGTEKKKMCMTVAEFDQFCKTIHSDSDVDWWPSHFKTFGEASEYVTLNLKKQTP